MGYTPIAVLVNIPATLLATGYYEMLMRDSLLNIHKGHAVHEEGEDGLMRHISRVTTGYDVDTIDGRRRDNREKRG